MLVGMVAGEASGDLLGSQLMRAIVRRAPDARFVGIGGPRMISEGFLSLHDMSRLSVMGLFEAAGRLVELWPVRRRLARTLRREGVDVFVGIDAPDFNLELERLLRAGGGRTVHYVSPSVWAWREYRVRKIRAAVDLMLTLFPFEQDFYRRHGLASRFVGHPLADLIPEPVERDAARARVGVPGGSETVALLPGSRVGEVSRLAGPMIGAAAWLAARRPGLRFVAAPVDERTAALVEAAAGACPGAPPVQMLPGRATDAMAASDVVLVASGTASLEAMLVGRPMVITYRTLGLTWAVGRRLLRVPRVGLPNLLAGAELVPELLQDEAVAPRLGAAVLGLLEQPRLRAELSKRFRPIQAELRRGASERAAEAVLEAAGA